MKHFTTNKFISIVAHNVITEWYVKEEVYKYDNIPHSYWNMP